MADGAKNVRALLLGHSFVARFESYLASIEGDNYAQKLRLDQMLDSLTIAGKSGANLKDLQVFFSVGNNYPSDISIIDIGSNDLTNCSSGFDLATTIISEVQSFLDRTRYIKFVFMFMIPPRHKNLGIHSVSSFERERVIFNNFLKTSANDGYNLNYINSVSIEFFLATLKGWNSFQHREGQDKILYRCPKVFEICLQSIKILRFITFHCIFLSFLKGGGWGKGWGTQLNNLKNLMSYFET